MITRAAKLQLKMLPSGGADGDVAEAVAYLDAADFHDAHRQLAKALHRLGLEQLPPSASQFGYVHLTNWLSYRAERHSELADELPDQFQLRNMLTAGEIFFVGLPSHQVTFRYA